MTSVECNQCLPSGVCGDWHRLTGNFPCQEELTEGEIETLTRYPFVILRRLKDEGTGNSGDGSNRQQA